MKPDQPPDDCMLISWVKTPSWEGLSSEHGYPVPHFVGTWEECEDRRLTYRVPLEFTTVYRREFPKFY
jgi:hypothetical protein